MAKDRFVEVYDQGAINVRKIILDRETGVNYLLASTCLLYTSFLRGGSAKAFLPRFSFATEKPSGFVRRGRASGSA